MNTKELKAKHNLVEWHLTSVATEMHTQISVDFAIGCLNEALKEYHKANQEHFFNKVKFKSIDDIVLDKIKNLKQ